jgi:hypothetical protein
MGAATSETASEPTTDRHRTWEAGEAIDVQVGRTPTGWQAPAALGRERSIPCHTAARPVALTWAILPVGYGVEATPSLPYTPRRATHDRTGGPLRNLRADPGRGATAFLAQPSLARSTRRSYDQTLTRLVHELGGDRPLSALTREAVTVAVTAAKNADARINNRAKRPAACRFHSSRDHAGARSERKPSSEAGGRVGVCPGLLRRPPSSESHRWRPLLVPPRSQ